MRKADDKKTPAHVPFASKVHLVPMRLMRRPAFLQKEFREARAEQIAANFELNGLGRLVVNHRDGVFFIIDGCHRHYALLQNGFGEYDIECEVYTDLTDEQMAQVFLLHSKRRVMSPFEKFNVNCEASTPRECDVRRLVESNNLKVARAKEVGCVSAVSALLRVYDGCGGVVLGMMLRTLNSAFAGDPASFDGQLMEALGLVFNRYNGRTNEKELTARLSQAQHGVRGILRRAEAQRDKTGHQKVQCIAAVVVDLYNRGTKRTSERLPSWWKDECDSSLDLPRRHPVPSAAMEVSAHHAH